MKGVLIYLIVSMVLGAKEEREFQEEQRHQLNMRGLFGHGSHKTLKQLQQELSHSDNIKGTTIGVRYDDFENQIEYYHKYGNEKLGTKEKYYANNKEIAKEEFETAVESLSNNKLEK